MDGEMACPKGCAVSGSQPPFVNRKYQMKKECTAIAVRFARGERYVTTMFDDLGIDSATELRTSEFHSRGRIR